MVVRRLPAKKVEITDLVNGKYFPGSKEELKPGYIITRFGEKISRVNLVASVTDKFLSEDGNYSTITIDDGSESIRVKAFKESVKLLEGIEIGDFVLAIGKLKEYNNETYINAEIVRKVDQNYESLRKLEILEKMITQKKMIEEIKGLSGQMSQEELDEYAKQKYGLDSESVQVILESRITETDYKPKILEIIEKLDEGNGVEISKLFEVLNMPENLVEKTMDELIGLGWVYEPTPGKIRKV